MSRNTVYKLYEQIIPASVCDIIVAEGKALQSKTAALHQEGGGEFVNEETRKTKIAFWYPDHWINSFMYHYISLANSEVWNYHISITQGVQFGMYGPGGTYDWHKDEFDLPFAEDSAEIWHGQARKLSAVINLSDPSEYTGGELLFRDTMGIEVSDTEFKQKLAKKGSLVVFPASVLHTVMPVIEGQRCSVVSWMLGDPFK